MSASLSTIAPIIGIILIGLAIIQTIAAILFARLFFRRDPPAEAAPFLPRVSVLLPLRGADPKLRDVLQRLIQQDYPNYEIQIVIDQHEDPAQEVVNEILCELDPPHVHVQTIKKRVRTCSPLCMGLSQAISGLDETCEVVAMVDGDALIPPTWLRELVQPLQDPKVGVTHGNRWYAPPDARWGSLVRYLWNAGAIVPMYFFKIPWGGSLAVRRKVLTENGLADAWQRAVVHDAPILPILKKHDLQIRFVPSLMMVNQESCPLPFSFNFIKRQMTWTHLYHPNWWPVLFHAVATTGVIAAATALSIIGLITHQWQAIAWTAGSLAFYLVTMGILLALLEISIRHKLRQRGEPIGWLRPAALIKLPFAILLAQIVYLLASLSATFQRRITWRGVVYNLRGPFDIEVIEDPLYDHTPPSTDPNLSI